MLIGLKLAFDFNLFRNMAGVSVPFYKYIVGYDIHQSAIPLAEDNKIIECSANVLETYQAHRASRKPLGREEVAT